MLLFMKRKIRACAQVHSIQGQTDPRLLFVHPTPSIILICNTDCATLTYNEGVLIFRNFLFFPSYKMEKFKNNSSVQINLSSVAKKKGYSRSISS